MLISILSALLVLQGQLKPAIDRAEAARASGEQAKTISNDLPPCDPAPAASSAANSDPVVTDRLIQATRLYREGLQSMPNSNCRGRAK